MVKDVVKSEYRMIVMWSCFQTVDTPEICSAGREEIHIDKSGNTQSLHVVSRTEKDDKHVVRENKQPRAGNTFIILLRVLYCNLESHDCQVPFIIN